MIYFIEYFFIRSAASILRWLPYSWIQALGRAIGILLFFSMKKYRKRVLSNLQLAQNLALSQKDLFRIAKESFQNLAIICLEYPRLSAEKKLSPSIFCENPHQAEVLHAQGKGIIFFCGHLSNWEILFLEGTVRMKGLAIGKPIKNQKLYQWILSIREKYGGKIVTPRNALHEGLKALRKGWFVGIVGDQGMPNSDYSSPFLGRAAWTSTAPALLSYKTGSPIIVATVRRVSGGYRIHYSDPIWPNLEKPMQQEVIQLMNQSLSILQEEIKKRPGEWLWQHNRWKQQTPKTIYKRFRYDSLCVILPQNAEELSRFFPSLHTLRKIYPNEFLCLYVPLECKSMPLISADEIVYYQNIEETMQRDYRFKLVFNFTSYRCIRNHYLSLSAIEVLDFQTLKKLALPHLSLHLQNDLPTILMHALCRKQAQQT